jgi:hypothetical protein
MSNENYKVIPNQGRNNQGRNNQGLNNYREDEQRNAESGGPRPEYNAEFITSTKFQFTRHAPSCNNINLGKTAGKDNEPGVVILGIIRIILHMTDKNKKPDSFNTYKSNVACVSNLYRTWITAFLMHGTNKKHTDTLELLICPYLKEKHGLFKRGNYPKDLHHTFFKFLKFLKMLHDLFIKIQLNGTPDPINREFFKLLQEYKYDSRPILKQIEFYKDWYKSLPKTINFYLLTADMTDSPYTITIKKISNDVNNEYDFADVRNLCLTPQILGSSDSLYFTPNKVEGYTHTGNLDTFIKWYYNNYEKIKEYTGLINDYLINNTLSVITHSNIMGKYIKKIWPTVESMKKHEDIKKQNCWNFQVIPTTQETNGDLIVINKFEPSEGVLITDGGKHQERAIEIEELMENFSLCGKFGSVENQCDTISTNKDNKYNKVSIQITPKVNVESVVSTNSRANPKFPVSVVSSMDNSPFGEKVKFAPNITISPPPSEVNSYVQGKPSMFSRITAKAPSFASIKGLFRKKNTSGNTPLLTTKNELGGFIKNKTNKKKRTKKYKK